MKEDDVQRCICRVRDSATPGCTNAHAGCDASIGLYFKEAVRRQLLARLPANAVYAGGLRVYTTIDIEMQKAAEAAVTTQLRRIEASLRKNRNRRDRVALARQRQWPREAQQAKNAEAPLQASLIAIDPASGHVLAMVGGRDFRESPFDRATEAKRQPGSSFKPLVYAGAIEGGLMPGTLLRDLDSPVGAIEGPWLPADGQERTEMTLRQALVMSSNRAAVHLLNQVGPAAIVSEAQRFGIHSPQPAVPSLALGSGEVTLLELTSAYAVLANRGERVDPTFIRRIETSTGDVLYRAKAAPERVVSEETAFLVTDMLADVIRRGTGYEVRKQGFTRPAAGKTGTTNQ